MNRPPERNNFVLRNIQRNGMRQGAPPVTFSGRMISVPGEDIFVRQGLLGLMTETSAFYLTLPANVFGVVIFPNGTVQSMEGGLHEVPPGLYKLQYVDKHERLDFLSPISEMSTDGEKITLTVVLRYRVIDPIVALGIDRPVETLIEHVEADVAQYIRTHDHADLAESSEDHEDSKLLSFFTLRHYRRFPLSKAFIITGIEIKDFTGDDEYVEMRRKASMELRKNKIEKEQTVYQQELIQLKAQYKAEAEKRIAEHTAELVKKAAEHKAEIENIEAMHEKEKQEILHQVRLLEIELDNRSKQSQRRESEFAQIIDALSRQISSGAPINSAVAKTLTDFLAAYREEMNSQLPLSSSKQNSPVGENRTTQPPPGSTSSSDRVEKLKNTLLNLLNPKK